VNDVVLAAVAGGLRALLEGRGEVGGPDGLDHVTALVPVSTRDAADPLGPGNQVSGILARLPLADAEPRDCLDVVSRQMTAHKQSRETELLATVLGSANWLPPLLVTVLSDLSVNRQPLVNLVITNVPGAQIPLYLLGARMAEFLPYVPLGGNTTVGVAILSYDGQLAVGVTSDPEACPDVDVLVTGMQDQFASLLAGS
jgi:diacylglycerol O-acyltransferase / wax synthase